MDRYLIFRIGVKTWRVSFLIRVLKKLEYCEIES